MRTHGNLLVLNRKQAEIWKELYEAAEDLIADRHHDGPHQLVPGCVAEVDADHCHICIWASIDRRKRLRDAIGAAGPELERVKDMFGPYTK